MSHQHEVYVPTMKKKTFRVLELARPPSKKMDPEDIAHRNRIKQMEREYDQICKKRVK